MKYYGSMTSYALYVENLKEMFLSSRCIGTSVAKLNLQIHYVVLLHLKGLSLMFIINVLRVSLGSVSTCISSKIYLNLIYPIFQ